jgi:hypothetical protein
MNRISFGGGRRSVAALIVDAASCRVAVARLPAWRAQRGKMPRLHFVILSILLSYQNISRAAVSPHPNIMWNRGGVFETNRIEIASDAEFKNVVDQDTIHNLSRYVPVKALDPGTYYWRAGEQSGSFEVDAPHKEIVIPAGSGMKEIRAALAAAKTNASTCIRFEPGTYNLHPGYVDTVFEVENTENLIIDGGGAKLVIHDIARLARVRFSKHITFRNFTVDYEGPIHTAAKVESVAPDGTMELSLWPGCVPPETVPRFMEEKRGLFSDPKYPRMAQDVPILVYMNEAWEPLGGNRYRLQAKTPSELRNVKPGMAYICAPRYKSQGIEIYNSDDVTWVDVTTYYLPGIGVVTNFANDLKLIRYKMLRRKDRLLAVQNGGTNLHGARVGPWVEGCRFENTGDDNNHISSLVLSPLEQPKPDTVVIGPNQPGTYTWSSDMDVQKGDKLAFFNRLDGMLIVEATVKRTQLKGKKTTIQLDRDLPKLKLGTGNEGFPKLEMTQIYNLSRSCNNFAFRNNAFVRGRRIGILTKSGPGLIENNEFRELGGGAIEIWNAPFEGLYAHDVLIQNNRFVENGVAWRNRSSWPAIWSAVFGGKNPQPLHRNIRILNNEFIDCAGPALHMADVDGLVVKGNAISNPGGRGIREEQTTPAKAAICLDNVRNETLSGNDVDDFRFPNAISNE